MVDLTSDIRADIFVRRARDLPNKSTNPLRPAPKGPGYFGLAGGRGSFPNAASIDLSDGARLALYGSERALELARDFNAARLGKPARRGLGQFFDGFARDLGATARDLDKAARQIDRLTHDLDRRFGDLADRIFGRLDSGLGGGFRTADFSYTEVNFTLQVDSTLLAIVKDGEQSLLRLDKVQLSLEAVQINGSVAVRDKFALKPKTPLVEFPEGLTASQIVDRLIAAFGTSSVTASLETQEIQIDLSQTIFSAAASDAPAEPGEPVADETDPASGVDVVA